jgi:hypothetical protein
MRTLKMDGMEKNPDGIDQFENGPISLYQMTKMSGRFVSCVKESKLTTWLRSWLRTKSRITASE